MLNAVQCEILSWLTCAHTVVTMRVKTVAIERVVWYAKFGSVVTNLPGTWSSLETEIMLLVSKDTLQRRRCL